MLNKLSQDPLEGKGEEMIPQRGLPFDDIDETPLEEIPPEERIPDFSEAEITPRATESTPEEIPADDNHPFDDGDEPSFQLSAEESEALMGDTEGIFTMEATPWELTETEAEAFMGSADEAFNPEPEATPEEDRSLHGPPGEIALVEHFAEPKETEPDMGMSTHLEDDPAEIEKLFADELAQPSSPIPAQPAPGIVHAAGGVQHEAQSAEDAMIELLVTDEDMLAMWRRADQAQKDVKRLISTLYIARQQLNHIQAARNELMAGKAYYEDAERHINEVEFRVQLSIQLDKLAKTTIPRLYVYLASWFIITVALLFIFGESIFSAEGSSLYFLAGSMLWGGMGGLVGALMPLIKHFSVEQDFAPRHNWWYIASPFVGSVMGAIIYLFMMLGSLSITSGEVSSPVIIYILSGLAGYQHKIFTNLVKRMLKVLEFDGQEEVEEEVEPKTSSG